MAERKSKAKEAKERYDAYVYSEKGKIASEPRSAKRIMMRARLLVVMPFRWLWSECHDWRFAALFASVCALMSSEVWALYVAGFVLRGTDAGVWCVGVASACWVFWLGPGTPFIPLCIGITIGLKALGERIASPFRKAHGKGEKEKDKGARDGKGE